MAGDQISESSGCQQRDKGGRVGPEDSQGWDNTGRPISSCYRQGRAAKSCRAWWQCAGCGWEVYGQLVQSSPFSPCFAGCLGKPAALASPSIGVPRVQQAPAVLRFKASSPLPRLRTRIL